jgi:hypothetical protein
MLFWPWFPPALDVSLQHAVTHEDADFLVSGWNRVFKECAELFVELFARAHASELNLDIFIRPEPRQQNQVLSKVHDLDRLAHVKDTNLAAFSYCRGLQYKLAGFGNGHKEATHLGMRHGDGSAGRNLLLENGNDAAAGA